jgi:hypothetical protein
MAVTIWGLQAQAALAQGSRYVVLMGDSLFACATGFLGGRPIVNLAVGGQTAAGILATQVPRLADVAGSNAVGVVCMPGMNDLPGLEAGTTTWAAWTATATAIVNGILAAGFPSAHVLMCSPPPTQAAADFPYSMGMEAELVAVCQPRGVVVCSMPQLFTDGTSAFPPNPAYYLNPGDGVHESTEAWLKIYNPVLGGIVATW